MALSQKNTIDFQAILHNVSLSFFKETRRMLLQIPVYKILNNTSI